MLFENGVFADVLIIKNFKIKSYKIICKQFLVAKLCWTLLTLTVAWMDYLGRAPMSNDKCPYT